MKLCRTHCFHEERRRPQCVWYRCCHCGKGKRRYRPGKRSVFRDGRG